VSKDRKGKNREQGTYPNRPTADWYTKPPATEKSKDRFRVIFSIVKAVETHMFAPFGEIYDPKNYYHLALRYYLVPTSKPLTFPDQEQSKLQLELSFGMLPRIAGLQDDQMSPKILRLADAPIGSLPLNNLFSAEWAACKREKLSPEEVLQLMGIRLRASLIANPVFNFWQSRDLFETSADAFLKITKKKEPEQEIVGYFYKGDDGSIQKSPARAEAGNFTALIQTLKLVNYFLGEPPLHQTTIDPRVDDSRSRRGRSI